MSEYFDLASDDYDIDPFGREVGPLEALEQDLRHLLIAPRGSCVMDPDWGEGLENYLGKPLPSDLSTRLESAIERDDRVQTARVRIRPLDSLGESYEFAVEAETSAGFLAFALVIARRQNELPPLPTAEPEPPAELPPVILSVAPVPETGGTATVVGEHFLAGDVVITDDVPRTTTFVDSEHLTAPVPAHAPGAVDVVVYRSPGVDSGASGDGALVYESVAPPDIITLPWTQYHEQGRSAATDYDPANAEPSDADPWVGLATAGPSAGRDLVAFGAPWTLPNVGPAVGSTSCLRFDNDLDDLKSQLAALNYVSVSAFTIGMLLRVDAAAQALGAPCIVYLNHIRLYCGKVGGVAQCRLQVISTIDNFADSNTFATGAWVTIFARFGAGEMDLRINKVNSASTTGVANISAAISAVIPRVAHVTNGTTIHDRLAFGFANARLSDADCDLAHDWWRHRFPSAGLP